MRSGDREKVDALMSEFTPLNYAKRLLPGTVDDWVAIRSPSRNALAIIRMWFEEKEIDYVLGHSGVYVEPNSAVLFKLGCPLEDYQMDLPNEN
jgi:hypothetical protein